MMKEMPSIFFPDATGSAGGSSLPFDVNDRELRESFFERDLPDAVSYLDADTQPLWGNFSPQHMLEHLTWAFQCSTGAIKLTCATPENLLDRVKGFLYDNRETPHDFRNPALGDNPPPLLYHDFIGAKTALTQELRHFFEYFRDEPDALHVHPIFGPLGAEEWHRSHYKHCYHHLEQFVLIGKPGAA